MAIHLIRHGSASTRTENLADRFRPLDEAGQQQAAQIAALFSDRAVPAVYSSPATRCVQTVTPLALAHGLEIVERDDLYEGADIDLIWEFIEGLARGADNAVLCSHGDLIPEIIHRAQLRGMLVEGKSGCSKGSIWSCTWDGERFSSGVYQAVPKR
jgi:phosphohistidine phosphatase SixA